MMMMMTETFNNLTDNGKCLAKWDAVNTVLKEVERVEVFLLNLIYGYYQEE